MFKVGDKVCFVSKSAGAMKIKEVNERLKRNILKDCYGKVIYTPTWGEEFKVYIFDKTTNERTGAEEWNFLLKDLIPYEKINYDDLVEIEE